MEKTYWQNFYSTNYTVPELPSQFACFVCCELLFNRKINAVVEVGMGNGRDMQLLASCVDFYFGIDQTINSNLLNFNSGTVTIRERDCTEEDVFLDLKNDSQLPPDSGLAVYSRFFLHAISDEEEDRLFDELDKIEPKVQFHEFRIIGDNELPKVTPSHSRRYIDPEYFELKMKARGWRKTYSICGRGFAKYKEDDALVCRLILEKV